MVTWISLSYFKPFTSNIFLRNNEVNCLKYDKLIQNSGKIVYFGHVRFPALLGKLGKLQQ